jgi:hypothetical protein
MKNIKLLLISILITGFELVFANVETKAVNKFAIINNSNAPISVNWIGLKNTTGMSSAVIPAGATGQLAYQVDTIVTINVIYYQSDGKTALDSTPLSFSPTVLAKALYVYGNSATPMNSLVAADSNGNQYPSRYVAWWSGNINLTTNTTAALAIADTAVTGQLVTMYMVSIDGKNSLLTF